jgi:hypothetical protein
VNGETVEVNIGDCGCAHSNGHVPHPDGDIVYLRPKPDLAMGLAAQSAIRQSGNYMGDTHAALYSVYVRYGVTAWNIRDLTGPVTLTHDALFDRLENPLSAGMRVAAKAKDLYHEAVIAPLVPAKSAPLRPSRKTDSTSRSRASGRRTQTSPSLSSPSEPAAGT